MKSTSAVAQATPSNQTVAVPEAVFALPIAPGADPIGLAPTTSTRRAQASRVDDEITKRSRDSHSFRHWGINE